ncbi:MAG: mannitol dehydrogenase family protein, partial [Oscillospiraceae bacterium]|nr:mannitol dehydrogenase family protein [Oscillospiraceae bacterium]
DPEIIDRVYTPFDNLSVIADLAPSGDIHTSVLGSIAESVPFGTQNPGRRQRLLQIAAAPSLQMISLTITEKGYSIRGKDGKFLPAIEDDFRNGPESACHTMSILCSLLYRRYRAGGAPIAVASMDNMSGNGSVLSAAVSEIARLWAERGHVESGFLEYLSDDSRVTFPWSMIDKITPRPDVKVFGHLTRLGIRGMDPIVTEKGTYTAPFVNAEIPEYLVVEDRFPNGRPALENAGVLFADRETVGRTERMKVTACLNPLHTALAVFGCLLGYERICEEMKDGDLLALVRRIGYTEGLPVIADPGIISPLSFLREVIEDRLPNPFIPDAPQRIATDTSQKIPIRFGETIKSYARSELLRAESLVGIPLAIAGWLRYLLGIDDAGNPMPLSSDPLLDTLLEKLDGVRLGAPESATGKLTPILSDGTLFGIDLYDCGLAPKIEEMFLRMLAGKGAVRETLRHYLKTN